MKKLFINVLALLLIVILSACEEVIVLDLNTTEPQVVIEADLDGTNGVLEVKCSKTVDFYNDISFNPVSGAEVFLEEAKTGSVKIKEDEPGIYRLEGIAVQQGMLFRLCVTIDDIDYEAEAIAPHPNEILEVVVVPVEIQGPPPEVEFFTVATGWFDIPQDTTFYCLRMIKNGEYPGTRNLVTDEDQDGELLIVENFTSDLTSGDTLLLQLSAINEAVYDYFIQVDDMRSNGFSAAAPYNPKGNFTNEALGYFGVCYTHKKEVVVP